jgi:hypothetical protein
MVCVGPPESMPGFNELWVDQASQTRSRSQDMGVDASPSKPQEQHIGPGLAKLEDSPVAVPDVNICRVTVVSMEYG